MKPRPWQWLVLFFTKPIRFSDFAALAGRLKPRAKAEGRAEPAPAATIDVAPMPLSLARELKRAVAADTRPSGMSSMFHQELEIGVSEQPLDTLPAELRDELVRPSSGGLQGSLSPPGGEAAPGTRDR
jgi:hypothetical protein